MAQLREVKRGDLLNHEQQNLLVRFARRTISGPGIVRTGAGFLSRPLQPIGGYTGPTVVLFGKITAALGSAPYNYSADEIVFDDYLDPSDVTVVSTSEYSGDHFWNLAELDTYVCARSPLPNGTIFAFWAAEDANGNMLKLFNRNSNEALFL